MAHSFNKKWQQQYLAQHVAAVAFASNEDMIDVDIPQGNVPMFSINDIFETKSHLALSLLTLEDPELDSPETSHIIETLLLESYEY